MPKFMKLGYFSEAKKKLIRFSGEEITPKPEKDEVVVFKSLFKARLRFPLNEMIADVLEKFGIYLHQLTPNAIVRLLGSPKPGGRTACQRLLPGT
jgi:hypothetical protein